MSELEPGARTNVRGRPVEVRSVISAQPSGAAYVVRDAESREHLLWTGSAEWCREVQGLLESPIRGFPELLAVDLETEPAMLLLRAPPPTAAPFSAESWRAAPHAAAVRALQELTRSLEAVHGRHGWLHGLKRRDLYLDLVNHSLYIVAAPRLQTERKPSVEAAWRDMRLIGELAFENFMEDDYPGGHEMAAMLQDRTAIADIGMLFPGLPQLLAGCVSPYGDLAYTRAADLGDGLEQLRKEIDRPLSFRVGASSTVGNYIFRKNNQDSCGHIAVSSICGSRKVSLGFFCVADGIGGIEDGEKASRLAVETACEAFARGWAHYGVDELVENPALFARAIAKVVGQRLALEGEFLPDNNRGGTTFSGLLVAGNRAAVCHVGDSRIVLVRAGRHIPLTSDHTLANILIALGDLTPEEAEHHELSQRTISRFLSTATEVEFDRIDSFGPGARAELGDDLDVRGMQVQRGDLFLLSSDGAHGEVDPELMARLAAAYRHEPQELCDRIVQHALEQIGRDNATILALLVE